MSGDGVHIHHCCERHGCKYGDDMEFDISLNQWVKGPGCPVVAKRAQQLHLCESCVEVKEALKEIQYLQAEIAWVEEFNARKNVQ